MDTPDELLVRILDVAVRKKKREDQLRRIKRDVRTRTVKSTEGDEGDFETFIANCNKFFHFY